MGARATSRPGRAASPGAGAQAVRGSSRAMSTSLAARGLPLSFCPRVSPPTVSSSSLCLRPTLRLVAVPRLAVPLSAPRCLSPQPCPEAEMCPFTSVRVDQTGALAFPISQLIEKCVCEREGGGSAYPRCGSAGRPWPAVGGRTCVLCWGSVSPGSQAPSAAGRSVLCLPACGPFRPKDRAECLCLPLSLSLSVSVSVSVFVSFFIMNFYICFS